MPLLTQYGYVVVEVDWRGAGRSWPLRVAATTTAPRRDAYEITEWLARQPWSTGKVGRLRLQQHGRRGHARREPDAAQPKAVFAGCFSWSKYDGFCAVASLPNGARAWDRSFEDDLGNQPVDGDEDRTLLRQVAEEHASTRRWPAVAWHALPRQLV